MKTFTDILVTMPECLQRRIINLVNIPQRPDFHPEGDTFFHTMIVFNRLRKFNNIDLSLAAILHDVGKDSTTSSKISTRHLQALGHEKVSAGVVFRHRKWIKSQGADPIVVFNIVRDHMRVKKFENMRPAKQIKMVKKNSLAFALLMVFRIADDMSTVTNDEILAGVDLR